MGGTVRAIRTYRGVRAIRTYRSVCARVRAICTYMAWTMRACVRAIRTYVGVFVNVGVVDCVRTSDSIAAAAINWSTAAAAAAAAAVVATVICFTVFIIV